ncbi:25396_t:CDS:2, partial [Gigaspora margarita]
SEKELVWVTHDETTFYVYDGPHSVWGPEGEQPLRKKGSGSAVHVSDFLTETIGPLKDDQEKARFGCQLRWLLGLCKASRTTFSEDTLVASKMNLSPGGLAPKMRETLWSGGRQSMIIEEDYLIYNKKKKTYVNLRGQPKGIQRVLSERGLWRDDMLLECTSCKKKEADPN